MGFYNFAKAIVNVVTKCFFRVEYIGLENIPQNQSFIVASNHRSLFDPIFIAVKAPMQFHFMAKAELFFFPFKYVMKGLGAFPVKRGTGDGGAIETAEKILSDNKVLAIFPEGTRSKSGKPLPAKSGIMRIAHHTKSGVLPVGITFKGKLGIFKKVTVRYGELIKFENLNTGDGKAPDLKSASEKLMTKILDLVDMDITLGDKK